METIPQRVALYLRVSTEQQAKRDNSIPSQRKELSAFAAARRWSIVREYVDAGESARSDDRPQFQQMLKDAREKPRPFDVLLVYALDRFARNRYDAAVNKRILAKLGVSIVSFTQQLEDSAEGHLLEGVIESVDQYYSERLAVVVRRGQRAVASGGRWTGGFAPFGYRIVRKRVGDAMHSTLEPDPSTAPLAIEIFERIAAGHTQRSVVEWLNAKGLRTQRGNRWAQTTLHQMLRNPAYIGAIAFNRRRTNAGRWVGSNPESEWVVREGAHEAIVSRDLWAAVRRRAKRRKPRLRHRVYLLSGIAHCAACGSPLIVANHSYYFCRQRVRERRCAAKGVLIAEAERIVLEHLAKMRVDEGELRRYRSKTHADPRIARHKKLCDALAAKRERVARAIEDGAEGLVERFRALDRQLADERRQLADLEDHLRHRGADRRTAKAWFEELRVQLGQQPTVELKALFERVVADVVIDLKANRLKIETVVPLVDVERKGNP